MFSSHWVLKPFAEIESEMVKSGQGFVYGHFFKKSPVIFEDI